jgi:hypothetical protein
MSIPVQYIVVGCVKNGIFTSRQYSFQVESYIDGKFQAVMLDAYEGKTIQIDGFLSPGDRLTPYKITVINDKCRPDLHTSKFVDLPQNTENFEDPRMDIHLKSET